MATWDDVERSATALPEVEEGTWFNQRAWKVQKKTFVWDRPLRKGDIEALGDDVPEGAIVGLRVEHQLAKDALVDDPTSPFFTIPHFKSFLAVLVALDEIEADELDEAIAEAWLTQAPDDLAERYLADR